MPALIQAMRSRGEPKDETEKMLGLSSHILFSTRLIPASNPGPGEWWYYGLEHGQHVSLYTLRALRTLAEGFRMNLYTNGTGLHLMTPRRIAPWLFRLVSRYTVAALIGTVWAKSSLQQSDFLRMARQVSTDDCGMREE